MELVRDNLISYVKRLIDTNVDLARKKTSENGKVFLTRGAYLKLQKYVKQFLSGDKEQRIVIIPGLRGVGKTTLLFQMFLWLLDSKKIEEKKLFYVSLDYLVENLGADIDEIFSIYEKYFLGELIERNDSPLFIFIDEAHYSKKWETFAKNLYDRNLNVFIFVSGSSAIALNSSTDSARRMIIEEITPLSFQEFLKFKCGFFPPLGTAPKIRKALESPLDEMEYILNKTYINLIASFKKQGINVEKELEEYFLIGGFPGALKQQDKEMVFSWIDEVLTKIVTKDIPQYSKIGNQKSSYIMAILRFFAESIPPSPQSANHLSKLFAKTDLSEPTVRNILKSLIDSCILCKLEPNASNSIKINKKSPIYYFNTSSLRSSLLWSVGKLKKLKNDYDGVSLEESVFNILLKNKNKCNEILNLSYDYKLGGCDFIVKVPSGNLAIEVGWGKKDNSQVVNSMKRIKCKGGIVINNTPVVFRNENILHIPRELILFS